jgi:predicted CXXCH cytochrome family protein
MKFTLKKSMLAGAVVLGLAMIPALAWGLQGVCSNCHTMHNSQAGTSMNFDGSGTPNTQLLKAADCLGCHNNGTANAGFVAGDIPQVMDSTDPTAAGYFVAGANNAQHNPVDGGVITADGVLSTAPGGTHAAATFTCAGATGCHIASSTHHSNAAGKLSGASAAQSYRFLNAAGGATFVSGIEDDDYEILADADHNVYSAENGGESTARSDATTISAFCADCHTNFHAGASNANQFNSGWIRHPTDFSLLDGQANAEHAAGYTQYSIDVPVGAVLTAYTDSTLQDTHILGAGTATSMIVVCTSCHRAHGSGQPDMLRWDYTTMNAGQGNSGGCFTCHSAKN